MGPRRRRRSSYLRVRSREAAEPRCAHKLIHQASRMLVRRQEAELPFVEGLARARLLAGGDVWTNVCERLIGTG